MKRNILSFAGAALLATGMIYAQATPGATPGSQHRPFMARRAAHMASQLGLTDAQKDQAKALFAQARQSAQPLRAQLHENRQALAAAVKAGNDADIQRLSQTAGTLQGQLTAIRTEAMAKFYASLTPEQKAKAEQLRQERRARWQQHRGSGSSTDNGASGKG